jgi:hypothetical protein
VAYRDAELNESLISVVKEVRQRVLALNPQEALILRRTHRVIPVAQYYLIRQKDKVQLAVLIYLSNSITDTLQMQRELKHQLCYYFVIPRVLFV